MKVVSLSEGEGVLVDGSAKVSVSSGIIDSFGKVCRECPQDIEIRK